MLDEQETKTVLSGSKDTLVLTRIIFARWILHPLVNAGVFIEADDKVGRLSDHS